MRAPPISCERHLLPDHHFGHARRAEVHRGVRLDHEHRVAERGDVRAARGRRAEQATDLRDLARQAHLVREDAARAPPAGEQLDLIGDARARGVDEIHDRQLVPQRVLGEPHDLLDRARAPRARLHRGVVGHHAHRAAVDAADAGHHTVGGQIARERVGEQPVFHERAVVEQQREPVAHEQLVLRRELVGFLREVARRARVSMCSASRLDLVDLGRRSRVTRRAPSFAGRRGAARSGAPGPRSRSRAPRSASSASRSIPVSIPMS